MRSKSIRSGAQRSSRFQFGPPSPPPTGPLPDRPGYLPPSPAPTLHLDNENVVEDDVEEDFDSFFRELNPTVSQWPKLPDDLRPVQYSAFPSGTSDHVFEENYPDSPILKSHFSSYGTESTFSDYSDSEDEDDPFVFDSENFLLPAAASSKSKPLPPILTVSSVQIERADMQMVPEFRRSSKVLVCRVWGAIWARVASFFGRA